LLRAGIAVGQTPPDAPLPWPEAAPALAPQPAAPATAPETRWYGWQTLLADVGAVTLTIVAATSAGHDDDAAALRAALIGGSAFLFGGPIVHAAHGHWDKAGYSLGLRVGLSLVGAATGAAIGDSECGQYQFDHEGCAATEGAVGLLVGATLAIIVDAAAFGRDTIPDRAGRTASIAFTPRRGGGGLSLIGRF